jgi:hypothetical protein
MNKKKLILHWTGLLFCIIPPVTATLCQFPLWVEKSSESTVSGLCLLFLFLGCIPFLKSIKQWLKNPSVCVMWIIFAVLMVLLVNIIEQMIIISVVGAIGNIIGAVLFYFEKRSDIRETENGRNQIEE